MSGLEVAGVILGSFPLVISGLEHCRDMAKIGGFYIKIRKEYARCRSDAQYHQILYKRNLKELLLPLISLGEVDDLLKDAGGSKWKSNRILQKEMQNRLQETYQLYMDTLDHMNEVMDALRIELSFDNVGLQTQLSAQPSQLSQPRPSLSARTRSNFDYQKFRVQFSLGESTRMELFAQVKKCNERLETLLNSSDRLSILQCGSNNVTRRNGNLEKIFRKVWDHAASLFKALEQAWECHCQHHHLADLRLEHRTTSLIHFDIILAFIDSFDTNNLPPWSSQDVHCIQAQDCSMLPTANTSSHNAGAATVTHNTVPNAGKKKVTFGHMGSTPSLGTSVSQKSPALLCERLAGPQRLNCLGVMVHNNTPFHLHPSSKRVDQEGVSKPTLGKLLSESYDSDRYLQRRHRYSIALLVASAVAQLRLTPWLRTELTKEHVVFPHFSEQGGVIYFGEPFIRQGFATRTTTQGLNTNDCNFHTLGILLLELCFGKRLEDHPIRQGLPQGDAQSQAAYDVFAALKWAGRVEDEAGEEYAAAVKWCFTGTGTVGKNWREEIIKNVIHPLTRCQEHFKAASGATI